MENNCVSIWDTAKHHSYNGKKFDSEHHHNWCGELGIEVKYLSPVHSHSNGQVEAINKTIIGMLKKILEKRKGVYAKELA